MAREGFGVRETDEEGAVDFATDVINALRFQIVKPAFGGPDSSTVVDYGSGMPVADDSPPLTRLASFGVDITAGTATEVLAPSSNRSRLDVVWTGTAGRLWLGFGEAAQVGRGLFLGAGQGYYEFTRDAVSVLYEGTGTVVVCGQEWGT